MEDSLFSNKIHIAIAGHVDHGKSTIIGHFLGLLGIIDQHSMTQFEKKAKELGEKSTKFTVITHQTKTEKERGITQKSSYYNIPLTNKMITLIDTPGHFDYLKRMIFGLFQADATILIVDVNQGMESQTFDVIHTMQSFHQKLIAVAITKMDSINYDMQKYEERLSEITSYLEDLKFDTKKIQFFPCSGISGEGLIKYSNIDFDDEFTLFSILKRVNQKQLVTFSKTLLTIQRGNIYYGVPGAGMVLCGMLESGSIRNNDKIRFEPISSIIGNQLTGTIKRITQFKSIYDKNIAFEEEVSNRSFLGITLKESKKIYSKLFRKKSFKGAICIKDDYSPIVSDTFFAEIVVLWHPTIITKNSKFMLSIYTDDVEASIINILMKKHHYYDIERGDWIIDSKHKKYLKNDNIARVEIVTARPIAMEINADIPILNKFTLREPTAKRVIGYGTIISKENASSQRGE